MEGIEGIECIPCPTLFFFKKKKLAFGKSFMRKHDDDRLLSRMEVEFKSCLIAIVSHATPELQSKIFRALYAFPCFSSLGCPDWRADKLRKR